MVQTMVVVDNTPRLLTAATVTVTLEPASALTYFAGPRAAPAAATGAAAGAAAGATGATAPPIAAEGDPGGVWATCND